MIIKLDLTPEEVRTLERFLSTKGYQEVCSGRVRKDKEAILRGQLVMEVAGHIEVQRRYACST